MTPSVSVKQCRSESCGGTSAGGLEWKFIVLVFRRYGGLVVDLSLRMIS